MTVDATPTAEAELVELLGEHEWLPDYVDKGLTTAHNRHSYHFACALCTRDLPAIASVLAGWVKAREAAALRDAADEIDRKLARDIRRAQATDLLRKRAYEVSGGEQHD
jgi:hypothetical protein